MLAAVRRHAALACRGTPDHRRCRRRCTVAGRGADVLRDRVPASGRRAGATIRSARRHRRTGRDIAGSSTTPPRALPSRRSTPGTAVFAGDVAGVLWVTLRHPDGVRTTYGPLATIAVVTGQPVTTGDVLGTTAGRLLLTARVGDNYVDPALLLSGADEDVHLVPEPTSLPSFPPASFGLGDVLSPDAVLSALSWGRDQVTEKVVAVYGVTPVPFALGTMDALVMWQRAARPLHLERCAGGRSDQPAARGPRRWAGVDERQRRHRRCRHRIARLRPRRRRAVLVSRRPGAGDPSSEHGTGFARGHARTRRATPPATSQAAAARLSDVLRAVAAAAPAGTSVDVYAHSQGGLVALDRARRSRHPRSVRARADRRRW